MLAVRGVYDGKPFRALPNEPVPAVDREVPIAIIFLEEVPLKAQRRQHLVEVAKRIRAARDAMSPLGVRVKDLVEAGRCDWRSTY
jgi:hypothetical protein